MERSSHVLRLNGCQVSYRCSLLGLEATRVESEAGVRLGGHSLGVERSDLRSKWYAKVQSKVSWLYTIGTV